MNRITSNRTVLSADSFISGKTTAAQAMCGRIVTPLIKTKDYEIQMATYVNNKTEGQPDNGVFFEVVTFDGEKEEIYSTLSPEMAVTYADEYTLRKYSKVRVNIQFDRIEHSEFEIIKDGTCPEVFKFEKFRVTEVYKETIVKGYGFIDLKDTKKAHKTKGLFVPSLAK